jgi:uncharacterized protein YegP (UPF0339 family)
VNCRNYTFKLFCRGDGRWSWRLIAPNRRIIATAGEGYASKWNALRAVRRISPAAYWATIKE